ncbi:MAG: Unknown protein [uncultured Sulfurovum sp.]|uniref:OmpA-like domain-containing protein n=1 Tax=uncultured Sulfurovum sp. TaxID=269237 RepID=A0A6S6SWR7_9BACT|nr:MAG: Unknown protein [uncultured Sulfurovum sp.]
MNRNKLIPILLFLLLLLIILCTWCHTGKIVKKRAISSSEMIHSSSNILNAEPINFYLQKNKNVFELQGSFSNQQEVEKIHSALGINELDNSSIIDENLIPKDDVLALTQTLLPLFYEKYETGSILYENNQLIIDGIVSTQADKYALGTLLANSKVPSKNNTIIVPSEPTVEEIAAIQAEEEAKLQAIKVEEAKKAKLLADEKAIQEAKELAEAQKNEEQKEQVVQAIEIKIKKIIAFEDINFELNKATLTEKSINTLRQIATVLKEHQNVHVEIEGHTDGSGDETYNLTLSQSRVDMVKERLVAMEVSANRIKAIGYGETKPLVSNDTEENRRKNRRVEFKILGE